MWYNNVKKGKIFKLRNSSKNLVYQVTCFIKSFETTCFGICKFIDNMFNQMFVIFLQCGLWHSVHIDDIHPAPEDIPSVADMHGTSVSALLASTKTRPEDDMEVEEGTNEQMMERMETNEDEVDLMDIQLEVKTNEKGQKFKRHFKIDNLIMKCLQPALGNVKDPMSDSSRAIDRLKIIHNCLKHEAG